MATDRWHADRSHADVGDAVGEPADSVDLVIERAEFGRTGHRSSRTVFGAAGLWRMSQDKADEVLALLLEFGVNHLDTAAAYGDSELRLAPWLAERRSEFFVATKTGERAGPDARAGLELSLERLGIGQVDLVQLHNLVEPGDWEQAFAPGGAVEALLQARDHGLTRFVGVTGHGLRAAAAHRRSLERADFDSVLLPYSYVLLADDGYRRDTEALLELCEGRGVAVQTIKAVARRRWPDGYDGPRNSWYEALPPGPELERAVRFVLAAPHALFVNTSSDVRLLRPTLEAAARAGAAADGDDRSLDADVAALDITPIFDGGVLDRI
jgi:aryl-alcohol dehydrogenase-like predicted oxidoreductase